MKRISALLGLVGLSLLSGCGASTSYVHSTAALGRVVVYRNGVAYFERSAHIEGDVLKLSVPADKVDDFLKSLTIIDTKTGSRMPISYPTSLPSSATGLIDMEIKLSGPSPHDLKLSYVTEAPSWKPSYRIMLAEGGKVNIEGWAVVDNTSGEDWENVDLGVGSSSALSFKFDLASVRTVKRDTLRSDDLLAVAPPTGGSVYGGDAVMGEFSDEKINAAVAAAESKPREVLKDKRDVEKPTAGGYGDTARKPGVSMGKKVPPVMPPPPPADYRPAPATSAAEAELDSLAARLKSTGKPVTIEGFATEDEDDKLSASLDRANKLRGQLLKRGVDPSNVTAVGKGLAAGKAKGGVRVVEAPKDAGKGPVADPAAGTKDPIGTSHFDSGVSTTVKRGSSAMVSILKSVTEGEIVYYYDPESIRGNASFPFKAVRIRNPTEYTLESGPVTVFGTGKFVGEGISEPIPPKQSAFIPFALDRQIVVEKTVTDRDDIHKIISVQRGVFMTEVRHVKKSKLVFFNRLPDKSAKVSIRHTVPKDYTLKIDGFTDERIGEAHLLGIEIGAATKKEIVLEETTPVFKSIDLRTPTGLDIVRLYVSSAAVSGPLKEEIEKLIKLQQTVGNLEQRITTIREQQGEYRTRMDELHRQIVTLKLVKTGGPLMKDLEKKLQEVSDRLSKSTLDLVSTQEELMLTKIRFQDAVSELTLDKDGKKAETPKKDEKKPAKP